MHVCIYVSLSRNSDRLFILIGHVYSSRITVTSVLLSLPGLQSGSILSFKNNILIDLPQDVWEDVFIQLRGTDNIDMSGEMPVLLLIFSYICTWKHIHSISVDTVSI